MKHHLIIICTALILTHLSCSSRRQPSSNSIDITGAWVLRQMKYPMGTTSDYSVEGNGTTCIIYDSNMLYECLINTTPTGLVIKPTGRTRISLIDKEHGKWLYIEDNNPRPLSIGDSTITIQRQGILYTYVRDNNLYDEWGSDMCNIIASNISNLNNTATATPNTYVLSVRERRQTSYIQWLLAAVVVITVVTVATYIVEHRRRHQLQLQLQQIREIEENRPLEERKAKQTVEDKFFSSIHYFTLLQRMATGELMQDDEWTSVEQMLMTVYPGFTTQLRSLYPMSELEYRTCLLIKLRIPPTDIAAVLARDVSSVSSIRSRLYGKVFGKKGGAKDWDKFILTLGH